MRKAAVVLLLIAIAIPAFALESSEAVYVGGTIPHWKEGCEGRLDLTAAQQLVFLCAGERLGIPYDRIASFEHTQPLAVRLGVAPAVAVGLLVKRRRNHFVRITFKDGESHEQVAMFHVASSMPMLLMPTLVARAPQANCGPASECGPSPRTIRTPNASRPAHNEQPVKAAPDAAAVAPQNAAQSPAPVAQK